MPTEQPSTTDQSARSLTLTELRRELEAVVHAVASRETRIVVEAEGVALVAAADLARLAQYEAAATRQAAIDWAEIDRLREQNRGADPDQVLHDVTEAVSEVRQDMAAEAAHAAARRR